jgi:hypothetical protein
MFIEMGLRLAIRTRDHARLASLAIESSALFARLRERLAARVQLGADRDASCPRTLDELLRERATLGSELISPVILSIGAALDAAHEGDAVHGDVRPANVLVHPNGRAKLLPHSRGSVRALAPLRIGYTAPERLDGARATPRTDVYGLGLVAFEMIAGRPAFPIEDGNTRVRARILAGAPRLRDEAPGVAEHVDEVVARAMAREPGARHATAGEFAMALAKALRASDRTEALPVVVLPRPIRAWRPTREQVAAALPAALMVIGVLLLASGIGDSRPATAPVAAAASAPVARPSATLAAVIGPPTPDVVGLKVNDVEILVDPSARARAGTVVRQEPAAGSPFHLGDRARLVVAGPYED